MGVTIKDVAKKANVAPSTVSRVLSNSPRISEDTKKRVRKAMKELGYHPNVNARSLAIRSAQALGLVMPHSADKALQNPFFPEVMRGISSIAHELHYSLNISTGESEEEIFEGIQRMIHGGRVDGLILLYSRVGDRVMEFLVKENFPFVVIGKPHEYETEITHVDNDNIRAAKEITNHLIELGHRNIAFIGGGTDLVVTLDRLAGYQRALKEADIELNEQYRVHTEFLRSGGQRAVEQLFKLDHPPTAIVIADDLMSLGVITMLEEFGLHVPDDISIVSFNNVYLSEISRPPLTTVDIQIYNLGAQAARCLIEKVKNKDEPAKRIIIPHEIIYRQSTKKAPSST
ncbi:MAG: LacI family DNA-binding transcriptional regulator [Bacillaceae bacterium]|nr:LacI family DNA-binding transcriptional regulator [Bacillaceae bacterium]